MRQIAREALEGLAVAQALAAAWEALRACAVANGCEVDGGEVPQPRLEEAERAVTDACNRLVRANEEARNTPMYVYTLGSGGQWRLLCSRGEKHAQYTLGSGGQWRLLCSRVLYDYADRLL